MKHVCHVIFEHRVFDARIFYKEAVSLARNGYEVTVLVPQLTKQTLGLRNDILLDGKNEFSREGVRFSGYPYNKKYPKNFGIRKRKTLQALVDAITALDADIYHFHEDGLCLEAAAQLKALLPGKKLVFDFHESFLHSYRYHRKNRFRLRSYLEMEEVIIRTADLIIGSSDFISEYYRTLLAGNVVTIMNCQSQRTFPDPRKANDNGMFTVVHEGRMLFNRGLRLLLDVARSVTGPNIRFLIIGNLPKKEKIYFDRYCAEHGIADKFEVTGFLPYEDVPGHLARGNLGITFLLTKNARTGLPMKFFNYIRYGMPVLSLPHPFIGSLITEHQFGMECSLGDAAGAAGIIDSLARYPDEYAVLQKNTEQLFAGQMNWESMEKRLLAAYAAL